MWCGVREPFRNFNISACNGFGMARSKPPLLKRSKNVLKGYKTVHMRKHQKHLVTVICPQGGHTKY